MTIAEWLKANVHEHEKAPLSKPFLSQAGGDWYTVASNGHRLVAVPGRDDTFAPGMDLASIGAHLLDVSGGKAAPRAALVEWCRAAIPAAPSADEVCETCKGEGEIDCRYCDGSGDCECDNCDADHPCGKCDGDGAIDCPDCDGTDTKAPEHNAVPGKLYGDAVIDRRQLLAMLDGAPGESVIVKTRGAYDVVTIHGDGWKGLLMPCTVKGAVEEFTGWTA